MKTKSGKEILGYVVRSVEGVYICRRGTSKQAWRLARMHSGRVFRIVAKEKPTVAENHALLTKSQLDALLAQARADGAAEEREHCANACEDIGCINWGDDPDSAVEACVNRIRARGPLPAKTEVGHVVAVIVKDGGRFWDLQVNGQSIDWHSSPTPLEEMADRLRAALAKGGGK